MLNKTLRTHAYIKPPQNCMQIEGLSLVTPMRRPVASTHEQNRMKQNIIHVILECWGSVPGKRGWNMTQECMGRPIEDLTTNGRHHCRYPLFWSPKVPSDTLSNISSRPDTLGCFEGRYLVSTTFTYSTERTWHTIQLTWLTTLWENVMSLSIYPIILFTIPAIY